MEKKSISITVHPSNGNAEFLTVNDALRQVLDMIEALEEIEINHERCRNIVWRLTDAHTNSPPFSVTAEAFPTSPEVSFVQEAGRVLAHAKEDVTRLMAGDWPTGLGLSAEKSLSRIFERNLKGISYTDVQIDGQPAFTIAPTKARVALEAIQRHESTAQQDDQRTEYGTVEGQVTGLTKHYSDPALLLRERLSGKPVTCVLCPALAEEIGPEHSWREAWQGEMYRFSGELVYGKDGALKKVRATYHEKIAWKDIPLEKFQSTDLVGSRSIREHLDEFWREKFG